GSVRHPQFPRRSPCGVAWPNQEIPMHKLPIRLLSIGLALVLAAPVLAGQFNTPLEHRSFSARNKRGFVSLNPQPSPPKEAPFTGIRTNGDHVTLNPQPIPPKEGGFTIRRR